MRETTISEVEVARARRFFEKMIPIDARHQMRWEVEVDGDAIEINERRPPWDGSAGEWSTREMARFAFDADSEMWTLWWMDGDSRWLRLDEAPPSSQLEDLFAVVEENPYGVFD